MKTIELFGKPFAVAWESTDRRLICSRDQCFQLVSFESLKSEDDEVLARALPAKIGKGCIKTSYSEVSKLGPVNQVAHEGTANQRRLAKATRELFPLKVIHYQDLFTPRRAQVFQAKFADGEVLYFREVVERDVPGEAKAQWQTTALFSSTEQVLRKSAQTKDELDATRAALDKAQVAASLTLQEALAKWMRFDPPRMAANTKARIEKAVKLYITDPDKRSLTGIAAEFKVSRKTVSTWFTQFTKETGFAVVRHVGHESVKNHLRAKAEQERQQGHP